MNLAVRFLKVTSGHSRGRGFTLVEMIAAIAMVTIVLTSVAMTISSLHRLNRKLRDEIPKAAAMTNFALRIRADSHAAVQATVSAGSKGTPVLQLKFPDDRTIEYSAAPSRIVRTVHKGEQVERTEVFELVRDCQVAWSVSDGATPLVTTTLASHVGKLPDAQDDVRRTTVISAIGLDQRNP